MKQFTIRWLLLVLLLGYGLNSCAQEVKAPTKESSTLFRKNAIVINMGLFVLQGTFNIYYERMLKQGMWNRNISSFVKAGLGTYVNPGGETTYTFAYYGLLTGVKTHHFEMSGGLKYAFSHTPSNISMPQLGEGKPVAISELEFCGAIGWRIQKPGGRFMFRMGVGYPEFLYAGVGFAF